MGKDKEPPVAVFSNLGPPDVLDSNIWIPRLGTELHQGGILSGKNDLDSRQLMASRKRVWLEEGGLLKTRERIEK